MTREGRSMQRSTEGADSASTLLVNSCRVGVWRFGSPGGWPLVWNHGGLSCGLDAAVMDDAGRHCGAEIIAIDRPGIGRSDLWNVASFAEWGHTVAQVADLLYLDDFAVAGWSGGGPHALACAAAMPGRVRAVATIDGMAPLERLKHVFEIGFLPDELLIPAARWTPWAAAALLQLIRRVPPRVLGKVLPHLAGTRDRAALDRPPLALLRTHRETMRGGVQGMVDEYRRYYGSWGFDLGDIQQPVTIWQGEEDTLVPMKHARRLAGLLPNGTLTTVPLTGHLLPVVMANEILDDLAPTSRSKSAQPSN
jgi:pimeloyl-ACP methyl ester carboxylesterase